MMLPLLLIVTTFLIAVALTWYLSRPYSSLYVVHAPTVRSLHHRPIPVMGGIAILTALIPTTSLVYCFHSDTQIILWIGLSGIWISIISFIDDYRLVSPWYRLFIHFFSALLLLWSSDLWLTHIQLPDLLWTLPLFLKILLSLLFVVWMVNLYNFMDGMDGFAGGMTIIGFSSFALLGGLAEKQTFMYINLLVASASGGFLLFNFPPARIFMGDVGSASLGFLAAAMSLWGEKVGIFPLWIALWIFSPFIVDATLTLIKRLARGEKVWQPHKTHYYQRLVQLGWGHKRTVLWEYIVMLGCSGSAILAMQLPTYGQWSLLILWIFIYMGLIQMVEWLERQKTSASRLV